MLRVFLCPKRVKMFICCFNNPDMDYLCKKAKSMVETSKIGKKIVKNASHFSRVKCKNLRSVFVKNVKNEKTKRAFLPVNERNAKNKKMIAKLSIIHNFCAHDFYLHSKNSEILLFA